VKRAWEGIQDLFKCLSSGGVALDWGYLWICLGNGNLLEFYNAKLKLDSSALLALALIDTLLFIKLQEIL